MRWPPSSGSVPGHPWSRTRPDSGRRRHPLPTPALRAQDPEAKKDLHRQISSALATMAELFLTDLWCEAAEAGAASAAPPSTPLTARSPPSFEPDAESRCEYFVQEAVRIDPKNPEAVQTYASLRISQQRLDEANAFMTQTLALLASYGARRPCLGPRCGRESCGSPITHHVSTRAVSPQRMTTRRSRRMGFGS